LEKARAFFKDKETEGWVWRDRGGWVEASKPGRVRGVV